MENRTDGDDWLEWPYTLRRGGEMARAKKVDDRLENLEVDEAKEEEEDDTSDGECPWAQGRPYPLDLVLDEDAMMEPEHTRSPRQTLRGRRERRKKRGN
ncbi:hypothetical protein SAY86_000599 [Trapa natans]|uniref:Uncharacterized protein n=1 Tax=Trapa natans TaxID=22666 RepID=A0AAN7RLK8_TRANT|nr:hypothetical protein SAY86_000599 [Trapa natans]